MTQFIQAKTILSSIKKGTDDYFGLRYNMNLYRGCQHGCIYCDSRSKCYGIVNFSEIQIKANALELLEKELRSKREKGTIGFGSMNDPYMPIEKELQLTRKALELIRKYRFPLHLITKSDLVVRDIDLLKDISCIYTAISITITSADDEVAKVIEPGAPSTSERFEAIRKLSKAGIYCGITLMPLLPYINDTAQNVEAIVKRAKDAGAAYILGAMGLTMREGQREYFYRQLDLKYPGLKENYQLRYGNDYNCPVPDHKKLWDVFSAACREVDIPMNMKFYKPPMPTQLSIFQ